MLTVCNDPLSNEVRLMRAYLSQVWSVRPHPSFWQTNAALPRPGQGFGRLPDRIWRKLCLRKIWAVLRRI